jgi:hypothetical protein
MIASWAHDTLSIRAGQLRSTSHKDQSIPTQTKKEWATTSKTVSLRKLRKAI